MKVMEESHVQDLLCVLQLPIDKNTKAIWLQRFISYYGAIPDAYGDQVRSLLNATMGFWKVHKESITGLAGASGEITVYECNKCGAKFSEIGIKNFNFCPNCRNPKKEFFPDSHRSDDETD